jgi:acetyl-CoA carboxylase biotin carboxyl carrier protein
LAVFTGLGKRMDISLKHLKGLLKTLEEGGAAEFEYQDDKFRVKVVRCRPEVLSTTPPVVAAPPVVSAAPAPLSPKPEAAASATVITSPFVGTFYRAPAPGAEPFVQVGSKVKQGQALCIVEAMKLMNEIEAEYPCIIVDVLVENAQSVEFGQHLFRVEKV